MKEAIEASREEFLAQLQDLGGAVALVGEIEADGGFAIDGVRAVLQWPPPKQNDDAPRPLPPTTTTTTTTTTESLSSSSLQEGNNDDAAPKPVQVTVWFSLSRGIFETVACDERKQFETLIRLLDDATGDLFSASMMDCVAEELQKALEGGLVEADFQ